MITRDIRVFSPTLGISGACDMVEFRRKPGGIPLSGQQGMWSPMPVEYKHGAPRQDHANELQLCSQAMCLEEMLCCDIPKGALYFGETRHRQEVLLTEQLRQEVRKDLDRMHELYERQHTPKAKPTKSCNACSLKEFCIPKLMKNKKVAVYLAEHLGKSL